MAGTIAGSQSSPRRLCSPSAAPAVRRNAHKLHDNNLSSCWSNGRQQNLFLLQQQSSCQQMQTDAVLQKLQVVKVEQYAMCCT